MRQSSVPEERFRDLIHYNAVTGIFTWLVDRGGRRRVGTPAGTPDRHGYICIVIGRRNFKAHRLAWFFVYGKWPDKDIDHIDGHPSNNAISNLREATTSQNLANGRRRSKNKSGFKGVVRTSSGRWAAHIRSNKRCRYLGSFDTPEEAHAVYWQAAQETFGEFARAN